MDLHAGGAARAEFGDVACLADAAHCHHGEPVAISMKVARCQADTTKVKVAKDR